MDLARAAHDEIVDLHRFFERWFRGEIEGSEASLDRFAGVLAETFRIVGPDGAVHDRGAIVELVRRRHGADPDMTIRVDGFEPRLAAEGIVLVNYREHQGARQPGAGACRRLSTAVFRPRAGTPHGVEWVHVHETGCET